MNHTSEALSCTSLHGSAVPTVTYYLVAFHVLGITLTLSSLLFAYIEAKKKLHEIENAHGPDYEESESSYGYQDEGEAPDLSMYEVVPEDIQKKEEKRRLRFGSGQSGLSGQSGQSFSSLSQIREDDEEDLDKDSGTADESGRSSRNMSDESVKGYRLASQPRDSLHTLSSDKSSRRTSDESEDPPARPSRYSHLPPRNALRVPKPLARTESRNRADYLLR